MAYANNASNVGLYINVILLINYIIKCIGIAIRGAQSMGRKVWDAKCGGRMNKVWGAKCEAQSKVLGAAKWLKQ